MSIYCNTRRYKIYLILIISTMLSACSQPSSAPNVVPATQSNSTYKAIGKASFYADKYQGRATASGELFNQNTPTAAHKTLPFGTWVNVTNRQNGKHVTVKINDRGPFTKGRIIDLSKSAFKAIANPRLGVVDVVVEEVIPSTYY